ncbi:MULTISPECIES: serine/threonine-protein kinase [unclassified Streptomyces]|uniref:serine/threonine-protein kinase n=3 Tax=Streptomyces TaxID=1883 RepID=UPI0001C1A2F3|nr:MULTISPECIES: serine/threonine-protein kinase [unclassified Streptomyces]MYT63797.1 protein kinase [Streptomyces sp. SID8357]MYT86047.1 protein kinase [Streptomyces sp. SID8360]MYW38402.1 protein kinase [Streptomyces sp. SID1]AEN10934.1 serine/threonine protein kinase [Streptomyces sp. SirexAA-E]PZX41769.1 serine/threonine protein kinase [Streptomyces sp. DvalAA-21]
MDQLTHDDPSHIGPYRLLARLGAGGMGEVYLARSGGGRTVAVKLVRSELATEPEFRRRFAQEIAAARRVGGKWTAAVLDADTDAAAPWVATAYVPGPSLHAVLAGRTEPLPERSVRILGHRLAQALTAVHAAGLIHRDLKPANVLVTIDGPRVIDFGIARALDAVTADGKLTRTGAVIGSPGYMSPEQVRGEVLTPAGDVFSLGSVLAFAGTRRHPFGSAESGMHAVMYRIAQEEPDLTGLPEALTELVGACLAKNPADRPTPEEVVSRTEEVARDTEPWLPAGLIAELGRKAAELLDSDGPGHRAPARPAGPPPGSTPPPPSAPPAATGVTPPPPTAAPTTGVTPPLPAAPPTPPPSSAPPAFPAAPPTPPPSTAPAALSPAAHTPPPAAAPASAPLPGPDRTPPPASATPAAGGPVASGAPAPGPGHGSAVPPPLGVFGAPLTTPADIGGPPAHPRPGPVSPPAPRRRRTGLIVAASVAAVALLAGGITYAASQFGSDESGGKDGKAAGSASSPAQERTPSAEPSGSTGEASPSAAAADPTGAVEGVIASEYLGVWEGVDKDSDGDTTAVRRLTITQGNVGADVVTTFNSFDSSLCTGSGELISFDNLMVVETRITSGIPDGQCSGGGRRTIRTSDDSTLTWTDDEGGSTVLSRASESETPIPAEFLGTWESVATGGSPSTDRSTLVLSQGAYGKVVARYVQDGPSYHCEDESVLVYANSRELRLGPQVNMVAEPEDGCEDGNSRLVRMKGADGLTLTWVGTNDEDDAPATYRRKG